MFQLLRVIIRPSTELSQVYLTSRTVSGSIPGVVTLGISSVTTDGTMCPGVDSASKNEYQGFLLGVKAAGARD
jgi:hypothetical protein